MKKNQRIIAGIAAIVVGVGIIVAAVLVGNNQAVEDNKITDENTSKNCPMTEPEGVATVNYDGVTDETALTTLEKLCDVTKTSSDYGDFVTGIEEKNAGDTHFWAFYVNDEFANEGAGTYKAKDGDKIKWVLTKIDAE